MTRPSISFRRRAAVSLLEMLAVVTLMGILAVIVIPRFSNQSGTAKKHSCSVQKYNIEVQCQLWRRQKNAPPTATLSNIGADTNYFPEGLPRCPVDNSTYSIDTSTLRVIGHSH